MGGVTISEAYAATEGWKLYDVGLSEFDACCQPTTFGNLGLHGRAVPCLCATRLVEDLLNQVLFRYSRIPPLHLHTLDPCKRKILYYHFTRKTLVSEREVKAENLKIVQHLYEDHSLKFLNNG